MKILKKRVNDIAIVQLGENLYTRTGITSEDWIQILEQIELVERVSDDPQALAFAVNDLLGLVDDELIAERKKEMEIIAKIVISGLMERDEKLRKRKATRLASELSEEFEADDKGFTYFKGMKHPLPKVMVDALLDAKLNPNTKYTLPSLINFWKYTLLNPDKHIREGLFKWLQTGQFAITEDGNIIAYRNVDVKHESNSLDPKLYDFVQTEWSRIKRQKKAPKNYTVYRNQDGGYYTLKAESKLMIEGNVTLIGNLHDLKVSSDTGIDAVVYTPQYKGPYGQNITLGEPVTMPREECDNSPEESCSRGLHCKSARYDLDLGSEVIVTLVNPYNVVAIPDYDVTKFRCCEYLPVSKAELKDGKLVEFAPGTYDIPYNGIEGLEKILSTYSIAEAQEKGLVSTELEESDFNLIYAKAKEVINTRIVH